jgi:hypothetical protein
MTLDLVKQFLAKEGFKCENVSENAVHFKYQGMNFFCEEDHRDQAFFRLIMPNIYKITDDRERVLEACNKLTADMKVLKAFVEEDSVWLSIEMFLDSSPEIEDFMERCLDILIEGWNRMRRSIVG